MPFAKITDVDLAHFRSILTDARVLTDEEHIARCSRDETEDFRHPPEVVLQPQSADEISAILRHCNARNIPVTPRGAGTGLSGGALALHGGVSLDMRRMNRILHLDTRNFQVTVEPGIITHDLQESVREAGLFYPPDPASKGSSFIGGNVSENSGGPKALKYGVVKDYVLNLQAVLPSGDIIWTGASTLKNSTGYNLTQLLVGSEGTLAVITQIVLRLIPAVPHDLTLLVPFRSAEAACEAVNSIFLAGISPSALEFMERDAIEWAAHYTGASVDLPEDIQAHLLIELDGPDMERLYVEAEAVGEAVSRFDIGEILLADTADQKAMLWALRRKVGEAVKSHSVYKEIDTVVPRAELATLLRHVKEIGAQHGFRSVCYGHAGDGNLHVNIIKADMSAADWKEKLPVGVRQLFGEVIALGGTLSGEHGIGVIAKDYMDLAFAPAAMHMMRGIKQVFDPNGILNPGKIFPETTLSTSTPHSIIL
jgi:glycolate oxidase